MKMNKMTILEKLGMIDKNYVLEADHAYEAAASQQKAKDKPVRKVLDWFSHGWGVAVICMLVAGGVFAAILYAGQNPPDVMPPAGTKAEESTDEEVTEPTAEDTVAETEPEETSAEDTVAETDEDTTTRQEAETQAPEVQDPKVQEILSLAPAWELPTEGRILSENAFMTPYINDDGEVMQTVVRTAILETDASVELYPLYFLADLLDEEGKVMMHVSQALPNVNGRVIYVAPSEEDDEAYREIGRFVVVGAWVGNVDRTLAPGERFTNNVQLMSTAFFWGTPSIGTVHYPGFVGSVSFGRNDAWDDAFVQSLQENADFSGKLTEMKTALTALADRATVIADTQKCYTPNTGKALDATEISVVTDVTAEELYTFFYQTYRAGNIPPLESAPTPKPTPTEFTLVFDGGTLTGYEGGDPPAELIIPSETPDGTAVTKLGMNCFGRCESIRSVVIPDTVHTIDGGAFRDCTNLEEITISSQLKFLYGYAFSNTNLKEIILPESCQYVDMYAFAEVNCDYVELWAEDIPQEAFWYAKIKNLVLREGVKRLNNQPNFEVENIYLPRSIELIFADYASKKYYFAGTEAEWESKNYHMEKEMVFEADFSDLKP